MSHIKREVIVYAHVGDGSENIVKNVEKQKKRERKKKKKRSEISRTESCR